MQDVSVAYPALIMFAVLTAVPTVIRNIISFLDRHLFLKMQDMFDLREAFEGSSRSVERVFVSAQTGEGLPLLRQLLASHAGTVPSPACAGPASVSRIWLDSSMWLSRSSALRLCACSSVLSDT